jgi:hypothetical protein
MAADRARAIHAQDTEYVAALRAGRRDARLPDGRRTARQRQIHGENLAQLGLA